MTRVGKVARSGFSLNPSTRTLQTEIDIPNAEGRIHPGWYATVTLTIDRKERRALPSARLASTDSRTTTSTFRSTASRSGHRSSRHLGRHPHRSHQEIRRQYADERLALYRRHRERPDRQHGRSGRAGGRGRHPGAGECSIRTGLIGPHEPSIHRVSQRVISLVTNSAASCWTK